MKKIVIIGLLGGLLLLSGCGKTNLSDTEYLQRAKSYLQQNDSASAVIELKNALQQNPNNAEARYLLGRQYLEAGNYPAAETALRRAMQTGTAAETVKPHLARALLYQRKHDEVLSLLKEDIAEAKDAMLLVMAAEAQLGKGDHAATERLLDQASQLEPAAYGVLLGYARLAAAQGDLERAREKLEQALQANPQGMEALRLKGSIALQQKDFENALSSFEQVLAQSDNDAVPEVFAARLGKIRALLALDRTADAARVVDGLLKRAPRHPAPLYFHALLAYQARDYEEAEDYLNRVLKQAPDHFPSLLLLGAIYYDRGNYEQAEQYLERYVSQAGNLPEAVMLLAATRLRRGQADLAMEVLRPAVEDTQDVQLLRLIGKAAAMQGDTAQGVAYLKRAMATAGDTPDIRVELANVYLNSGDYDDAIKALEPLATGEQDKRARAMLVFAHLRKKDFQEALRLTESLVADYPDEPGMLTLLGGVQMAKGDEEAARSAFEQALAIDENFIPARHNLARLYFQKKDYAAADRELDVILARDGKNLVALIGKAQVTERLGDREAALEWWEKARSSHPEAVLPHLVLAGYNLRKGEPHVALAIVEEALARNRENVPLLLTQGRAQLAAGMPSKALRTYEQLAEMAPDEPSILYALSGVQMQLNQREAARKSIDRLLELDPDNLPARIRLIQLEVLAQRHDAAMKLARSIQKDRPNAAVGYVLAGDIALSKEDFATAQRNYKKALELMPSEKIAVKLAESVRLGGDGEAARGVLESWLKARPDDENIVVKSVLAMTYHGAGQEERARALYEEILAARPEHVIALNNLSYFYLSRDPAKARQFAERAYRLAKDSPAVQDTLGWALVQEGAEVARGVRLLREASEKAPQSGDIRYHLAAGLERLGRRDEARKILEPLILGKASFSEREAATKLWERLK